MKSKLEIDLLRLGYVGTTVSLHTVLNTPKNLYLNQATQEKYLPNFPTPKNPGIQTFTLQKVP